MAFTLSAKKSAVMLQAALIYRGAYPRDITIYQSNQFKLSPTWITEMANSTETTLLAQTDQLSTTSSTRLAAIMPMNNGNQVDLVIFRNRSDCSTPKSHRYPNLLMPGKKN
ncbi:MAG: hypothetical protein QM808_03845 [Steroidobacteraceae bacterium]